MPNVEYIGSTSFAAGNGTSIGSIVKPTGTEVGHCLIAQMYIEVGSSLGSYTISSTGDTWTLVNSCTNTGATPDFELVTWICIVGNATSIISVSWNGTNTWRDFAVHTFNNVDATTPEDCASTNNTGNSTTETGLGVTTATDGAHLVLLTANFDGFTRSAQTSPLTERNDGGNVHMASGTQLTAGASGNKSATITSGQWGAVLMALRPATGIINFGGFETGDFSDAVATAGTVSIQSSTKRTGGYALRINPTAGTGNAVYGAIDYTGKAAEIQRTGTTYVTFYLYVASRPAANCALVRFRDSSASEVVRINLDTAGEIRIVGTTTSADIATLANNTWYRIDMRITSNGTCGLSVDGGTETTLTGNNFTFDRITFGPTTTHTLDAFIDDWAVSDAGFVTTPEVTVAVPTGAGNYSSWTDGTGSTFAEVDEVPHDSGTTYLQNTSGTNVGHTLAMQDTGTIGASGTIAAVKAVAIMAESSSTTTRGSVRLRSGSSDRDTFPVDIGNTSYVAIQRVFTKDPATAAAWTSSGVDAIEVGPYKGSDTSSIRATAVYAIVLTDGGGGVVNATISGEPATATAAGVAGAVAASRIVGIAGEVATATSAGVAGSVATVRNATIAGEPATASAAGLDGTVTTTRIATIAGEPATAAATGLAGSISGVINATIAGEPATATAAGMAGTVTTVRVATIAGEAATATAAGLAGAVSTVRNATIAGEPASANAAGLAGAVSTVRNATIAGAVATATATGIAGSLSGASGATITGEPATATAAGLAGSVATVRIATISGEPSTADAAGIAGTVVTVRNAAVQGETATSTATGIAGSITAVRVVTVAGEPATATASGNAGSLSGGVSSSIGGATATASASGNAGTVAAVRIVAISGATATADAAGEAGTAAAVRIAGISGTTATATSVGLSGAVAAQRVTTVAGEAATATALGSAGSVTGIRIVTIAGTTATATAAGVAGAVSTGVFADNEVFLTVSGSDTATMTVSGNESGVIVDGTDTARITITGGV